MIVAIEGMDGVGKTTVAKIVAEKLHFKYIKEPLKEIFEIDDEHINRISNKIFNNCSSKLISLYLSLGDNYLLEKYRNDNIIIDRHVLLNYYWNGCKDTEQLFELEKNMFGIPDLIIILEASINTRKQRLLNRNVNDVDLNDNTKMSYGYDKLIEFVKKYNYNYVVINTDNIDINEIVNRCTEKILNVG